MQYRIDYMKDEELDDTLELIKDGFDEFDSKDYSDYGIECFYKYIEKRNIKKQISNGNMLILVARTTTDDILGTIAVSSENHISLLFVNKKFHNKGIGKNLLKFAINVCKYNDENLEKITVNASLYATSFYQKNGFKKLSEMQENEGIKYIPMCIEIAEHEMSDIKENDFYQILNNYYTDDCEEEFRLTKSRVGNLEFITTINYIDKYICKGDKILDIGAGAGIYSNYYASQGYKVDAIELLEINYKKLKCNERSNLKVHKGNAIDLSKFSDNTFDITLCLGPLYHLFSEEERNKAISEAIRVTKPYGKIFFAYITNDSIIINNFLRNHMLVEGKNLHDEEFKIKNDPHKIFYISTVKEFKTNMKNYDVRFLNNVATDGISNLIGSDIEALPEEEFEEWVKYHLSTCEREDLMGYSMHVMYICEKE